MKVVFDTNCYFAAAARPNGYMYKWLETAVGGSNFTLYTSREILFELQEKLEKKLRLSLSDSVYFCRYIEDVSEVVYPTARVCVVTNDPDDNKILECAVAAKANLIITFDNHLLKLKRYEEIVIAHPRMLKHWFSTVD